MNPLYNAKSSMFIIDSVNRRATYYKMRGKLPGKVGSQVVYEPVLNYAVMRNKYGAFYSCHVNFVTRNRTDGDILISRHETIDDAHNTATRYAKIRTELRAMAAPF